MDLFGQKINLGYRQGVSQMSNRFSYATGNNAAFIESLYETFKEDPSAVEESWRKFFEGYEFALAIGEGAFAQKENSPQDGPNHAKIEALINAYRRLGHLSANLNPLEESNQNASMLDLKVHGLGEVDRNSKYLPANFGKTPLTVEQIVEKLHKTYCRSIGADFRDINDIEAVVWLQEQMEGCSNSPKIDPKTRGRALQKLAEAEGFERFLQARYLGQKRFSLEGLEALIPLLDVIISESGDNDVEELCIGMAHRGRLNVLANIMQKPYTQILSEFEGRQANPFDIDGDVKYHLGFCKKVKTFRDKEVILYLSPNPSHLEAVNPVIEGLARCRQEATKDGIKKIIPVLLHGDASFIGQGLVAETLNLSKLPSYQTGGSIHIITNNQIGFTTNPSDSRSCSYSSDISKVIRAPVFHVNADDPDAVIWVSKLALMYRQKFHEDVVIDLVGYRRHGHNETDEPSFTQPLMYRKISKQKTVLESYANKLTEAGELHKGELERIKSNVKNKLQEAYETIKSGNINQELAQVPASYKTLFEYKHVDRSQITAAVKTNVKEQTLKDVVEKILEIPENFNIHPKLKRIFSSRKDMVQGKGSIDWGLGEILSFATLANDGFDVRLSGQDCKRGTFSSRHGVIFDHKTGDEFEPLNQFENGKVTIINSPLSEQGCLGFEFGYSVANPKSLVLWEAQFGDFANGAQIIIDQFISASEAKWQQTSGLVLLLPHGYEGMGPEHSSARPERFLLCSGNLNLQVCNVTTPAQMFHVLRRQMIRDFRKPLVIMTPKSLLRHPMVRSELKDFTENVFTEIIDDASVKKPKQAKKIIICSGKIFYELVDIRAQYDYLSEIPVVRIEQLYPFPFEKLKDLLDKYINIEEVVWVQEEPQNMGAWNFIRPRLENVFQDKAKTRYVGRKHSGSTAEGSGKAHQVEQRRIIEEAFGLVCAWDPVQKSDERKKFQSL